MNKIKSIRGMHDLLEDDFLAQKIIKYLSLLLLTLILSQ